VKIINGNGDVDGSSLTVNSQPKSVGLVILRVGGHLVLSLLSPNKSGNSRNGFGHDDSTIFIVLVLLLLLLSH